MPVPDIHPLHEVPVSTTTPSVVSGQTAAVRAPFNGRVMKISAAPTTATTGGTGTCTLTNTNTATTIGAVSLPISTATDTGAPVNGACSEGDLLTFLWSGAGTAGGVTYLTAYVRRIG